jgi:hypothetical protein
MASGKTEAGALRCGKFGRDRGLMPSLTTAIPRNDLGQAIVSGVVNSATEMRTMIKSALLGMGIAAVVATAAAAQSYYPYYYPGYSYSYPGYNYPTYNYPTYGYPYGYSSYYGSPYSYQAPSYQSAPAYSDPYVAARPYSSGAGPKASGHVGY